jgi:xylulokinase
VIFLPYMLGERTPRWNPMAKGAFIGLGLATRRADLLRAVLEGITMNLAIIVDIFRQHVPIEAITVIGGGAKGAAWRQMMADMYDCRMGLISLMRAKLGIFGSRASSDRPEVGILGNCYC